MCMPTYTIKISRRHVQTFIDLLALPRVETDEQYVSHYFATTSVTVKIFENTKHDYVKALVRGTLPAATKLYYEVITPKANETVSTKITTYPQLGSDEVGFGDFFGPLVVVAAQVRREDLRELETLRITDSKKLSDDYIISIGPLLSAKFMHRVNIVSNEKYNSLISEGYNMNKMKAMLHVNVLRKLSDATNVKLLLLDRFVSAATFAKYVSSMAPPPLQHISDGERNALSIALASVLARYYFLQEIHKINTRFKTNIPLGAGAHVDTFAQTFLKKHGKSALLTITKHNFRNFTDLCGAA